MLQFSNSKGAKNIDSARVPFSLKLTLSYMDPALPHRHSAVAVGLEQPQEKCGRLVFYMDMLELGAILKRGLHSGISQPPPSASSLIIQMQGGVWWLLTRAFYLPLPREEAGLPSSRPLPASPSLPPDTVTSQRSGLLWRSKVFSAGVKNKVVISTELLVPVDLAFSRLGPKLDGGGRG